jgi:hypothetical protein
MSSDAESSPISTKVRVVVRVRPLLPAERDSKDKASKDVCVSIDPLPPASPSSSASNSNSSLKLGHGAPGVVSVRETVEDSFGQKNPALTQYMYLPLLSPLLSSPTHSLMAWHGMAAHGTARHGRFDACYGTDASTRSLFTQELSPYLGALWRGHCVTVFCVGMTGTGKTHTYVWVMGNGSGYE